MAEQRSVPASRNRHRRIFNSLLPRGQGAVTGSPNLTWFREWLVPRHQVSGLTEERQCRRAGPEQEQLRHLSTLRWLRELFLEEALRRR